MITIRSVFLPFVLALAILDPAAASPQEPAAPASPTPGPASEAGESEDTWRSPSVGGGLTFVSAYVWRGFVIGRTPSLQAEIWASFGPLTVTSWSNAFVQSGVGASYTEHDLTVDYSREVRGATLSLGWTNYMFPRESAGRYSNEIYAAIAGAGYFNPRVQVFLDVHEGKGTYLLAAARHEYAIAWRRATLTPSVSVGYNHQQWTSRSGFSDIVGGVALSVPLPRTRLVFAPFVNFSCGLDDGVFPRQVFGGATLSLQ